MPLTEPLVAPEWSVFLYSAYLNGWALFWVSGYMWLQFYPVTCPLFCHRFLPSNKRTLKRLLPRFRLKFVIGHTLKPGLKVSVYPYRYHLLITGTLILTKLFSVLYDVINIFSQKPTCGNEFPNLHCRVSICTVWVFWSFSWALILIRRSYLVLKPHFNPWIKLASCIFHFNFNLLKILLIYSVGHAVA
jgi:hypothetical protein